MCDLDFAVAAFLEPEILIVDEVLAVGDAEFQKKAIGKMQDVSRGEGRTVLFVSHNMGSISRLCTKCLLMEKGRSQFLGATNEALEIYSVYGNRIMGSSDCVRENNINKKFTILGLRIMNGTGSVRSEFIRGEEIFVEIEYEVNRAGTGYNPGFEIWSKRYDCIFTSKYWDTEIESLYVKIWTKGTYKNRIKIPQELLKGGSYYVTAAAAIPLIEVLDFFPQEIGFKINDLSSPIFKTGEERNGIIIQSLEWL
jgi:lipopolysaccharide transport system ATP-binding protein